MPKGKKAHDGNLSDSYKRMIDPTIDHNDGRPRVELNDGEDQLLAALVSEHGDDPNYRHWAWLYQRRRPRADAG